MGKVIREICLQSLNCGGCFGFGLFAFKEIWLWPQPRKGHKYTGSLSLDPSTSSWLLIEWLAPSTVTLTYWPSQLRDYGFQSPDHLHTQQASCRWMRGVKAWMADLSRRWKMEGCLQINCQGDKLRSGDRQEHTFHWSTEGSRRIWRLPRYARLFMPLRKPGIDQHKRSPLVLGQKKEQSQSKIFWSAFFPVPL